MEIRYFGKPYSFTHIVALKRFGKKYDYFWENESIEKLLEMAIKCNAIAVIPAENSYCGEISETTDVMCSERFMKLAKENKFSIAEELETKIELYLSSHEKTRLSEIKEIYSHPFPLKVAREWIKKNLPKAKVSIASDTSDAVSIASRNKYRAAISSIEAAEHYRMNIIRKIPIAGKENITRFYVFKRKN
jgi:chorismate mutase/prephenate dehydratase